MWACERRTASRESTEIGRPGFLAAALKQTAFEDHVAAGRLDFMQRAGHRAYGAPECDFHDVEDTAERI
jgi:hypothetical protein